ncbi:MAG: hypothetical protein QNJ54_08385 [Prochloraceae cyanobacterium]|nr:hypothetical protein [Prochloraceae cyanobacterium]
MKWEYELGKELANWNLLGHRVLLSGTTALLLGTIGALLLAPIIVPAAKKVGKSVAKTTIKGGMTIYEGGKELVSEAKAELEAAKSVED